MKHEVLFSAAIAHEFSGQDNLQDNLQQETAGFGKSQLLEVAVKFFNFWAFDFKWPHSLIEAATEEEAALLAANQDGGGYQMADLDFPPGEYSRDYGPHPRRTYVFWGTKHVYIGPVEVPDEQVDAALARGAAELDKGRNRPAPFQHHDWRREQVWRPRSD